MSEEKKKRLKEYQKSYRFQKCRYVNKSALQNCYHKDMFNSLLSPTLGDIVLLLSKFLT